MDKKLLLYGGVAIAVVVVLFMIRGSGGGSGNSNAAAAISTAPSMASATAQNNMAAYEYLASSAASSAQSTTNIFAGSTVALSNSIQEISANIASMANSDAQASSVRNASVSAVRIAQLKADTDMLGIERQYLLGKQSLENDAAMIGIQLPLARINADTTLRSIDMTTYADMNIATVNANRDVSISQTKATTDQIVAKTWADAAIQQAYYQYKAIKAQVQGPTGAIAWGNLLAGKSAAVSYGPISAQVGASSNSGGSAGELSGGGGGGGGMGNMAGMASMFGGA